MNMNFFELLKKEIIFQNRGLSLKETGIFILATIFLLGQWGCAAQHTSHSIPTELGKVGLVSAQYTPAVEFEMPAKGWLGGAARGAAGGTKAFIVLVPAGAVTGGAGILYPPALLVGAVLLVSGAGYLIIGPFYGAATAEAPVTVEEAEAKLKAALGSMRIQETMRDHVVQAAQSLAHVDLKVIDGQGPESSSDLLTYFPLQDGAIDSVLELRVNRVWLSTDESVFKALDRMKPPSQVLKINPTLSVGMEVRGRLIRTADKVVLYDNTWKHEGGARIFTQWAANDAQLFAEEFERAYEELAEQLSTSIFQ